MANNGCSTGFLQYLLHLDTQQAFSPFIFGKKTMSSDLTTVIPAFVNSRVHISPCSPQKLLKKIPPETTDCVEVGCLCNYRFHKFALAESSVYMHVYPGPSKGSAFIFTVHGNFGKWLSYKLSFYLWSIKTGDDNFCTKYKWILKAPSLNRIWHQPVFCFLGGFGFFYDLFLLAQFNTNNTNYLPMGLYSISHTLRTSNDFKTVCVAIWTSDSSNIK